MSDMYEGKVEIELKIYHNQIKIYNMCLYMSIVFAIFINS